MSGGDFWDNGLMIQTSLGDTLFDCGYGTMNWPGKHLALYSTFGRSCIPFVLKNNAFHWNRKSGEQPME